MTLTRLRNHLVLAAVILAFPSVVSAADFTTQLREADRLAWLTDWYTALPIYGDVEKAATKAGNRRDALYAKFGRLRGQMQNPAVAGPLGSDRGRPRDASRHGRPAPAASGTDD